MKRISMFLLLILSLAGQAFAGNIYGSITDAGKPVGLVLELGQLGQPAHEVLWTPGGLEDLGRAVATGIRRWLG